MWAAEVAADAGDDYLFVLDGDALPDPCSRFQPEGVRGPSRVVDTSAFAIAPGPEPRARRARRSTSCTSARSRRRGRSTASIPRLRGLRELGHHRDRADAGRDVPGRSRLGLRRRLHLRAASRVRRARQGSHASSMRRTARASRVILDVVYNHIGPGSEAIARVRPVLHRPLRDVLGRRDRLLAARRARVGDPERDHVDDRLRDRRPAARRGARDPRRLAGARAARAEGARDPG